MWNSCTKINSFFFFLFVALLSKSDFLKLRPPSLNYIYRSSKVATTIPRYVCAPQSVVAWHGFKNDVNRLIWDDTPKYAHPTYAEIDKIGKETDVQDAFYYNVLFPLNILLKLDQRDEVFARSMYTGKKIIGEPDFILRSNRELRLAIEVKTKWALPASNLVKTYTRNLVECRSKISIIHPMEQIFGYLSYNQLQFGVLTTYDKTWFLCRNKENLGQVRISPPIQYNDQMPTLFQCLFYLIHLSRNNHRCGTAPALPPISSPPSHLSNGEGESIPLNFFNWGSFNTLSVLGEGRSGTVFKAILHGEIVALKICDLWQHPDYEKELHNEVKVYHALKGLQGDCIPRLKGAGYTAGGLFAIATDIVGSPLEDVRSLSDQERLVIQRALSSIHCHGFVHNDIHEDNILIKRNGSQFYASFIDFTFSKHGSRHGFQNEMEALSSLLGSTVPLQQGSKDSWRPSAASLKGSWTSIDPIHRVQVTLGRKSLYIPGYWSKARAIQMGLGSLLRHL